MTGKRKRYSAEFKAKVALEAIRSELAVSRLVAKHGVRQTLINAWKKQAVEGMAGVFSARAEGALATLTDHGQLRLRQRQGACRFGDDPAGEDDTGPSRVGDDRDGMPGAGNFHGDTPCSPVVAPVMAWPSCLIPATLDPDRSGSRASAAWAGRL